MSDTSKQAELSVLYGRGPAMPDGRGPATPAALGLPAPMRLLDGTASRLVGRAQGRPQGGLALTLSPRHRLESGLLCAVEMRAAARPLPDRAPDQAPGIARLAASGVVCAGAFDTVWLLRAAGREARHLREAGGPALRVSVPLARQGGRLATMAQQIRTALAEAGQPAGTLELALGETDLADPGLETPMFVSALRDLGAGVALDMRGGGRDYLQLMRRLPVTALRLHPALVSALPGDAAARSQALEAICMAHAMGALTVALGVETAELRDILAGMQCDEAQGSLFRAPSPWSHTA